MAHSILELAYQLSQTREAFVLATVVWCERPTSAKPGAQAVIQANGQLTGWIGGSCSQPVVIREAMQALRKGCSPFLLRLGTPNTETMMARTDQHDLRVFPMTCSSGGTLDIYMEPHLPRTQLVLIGNSPVISALSQLAPVLDFTVSQFDHAELRSTRIDPYTYILIATHGEYDEDALAQALTSQAAYVGLVASHRRAEACCTYLRSIGIDDEKLARLKAPAGLDIGAVTPQEIAASIIAELVQLRRRNALAPALAQNYTDHQQPEAAPLSLPMEEGTAIDPVCDMIVVTANARHHTTYDGREYYFCCPACKRLFEQNPQEYLVQKQAER